MMNQAFDENRRSAAQDPLVPSPPDFDWEGLYARLGEDAREADQDPRLAGAVIRLLDLFLEENQGALVNATDVGLRVIALAWVLNPAYFDGSPSLRQLAQRHAWNWWPGQRSRSK